MRSRLKNLNRHIIDRAVAAFAARLPAGVPMLDIGAGGGHYRGYFGNQLFTYLLAPILLLLDRADTRRHFTLGYICVARKRQEPVR